ncbi:MAG: hypothetical protein A2X40_03145 [Elusimicrobia bacterium GWC2_65_9]|nr:MAG: hypothetical protein A2X37_07600 [Elusimicrobia bacterium GWA2_66_18]OGR72719.1 MAG: hypothetical protein A2X40_03145 [Elusimicrobia bacterium GWC2_65_9]
MRRLPLVIAAWMPLAPAWAAKIVAPESVRVNGSPTAPSLPVLPVSAVLPGAAPTLSAVPGLTAASISDAPISAQKLVEKVAAPLADPKIDAASHLDAVYDSVERNGAVEEMVAAPADGPSRRRSFGLTKVAAPTAKTLRHEYKSPEGAQARELQRLTASLSENFLPPAKTAVVTEAVDSNRPTVVILSPASRHKVAIAREGGKQSPGDVHLALDASWLIQEEGPDGRTRLLLKKGVTFDDQGRATVVEYHVPRVVRYFANYFTLGANDRDDGLPFEKNLDLPQSNSLKLEAFVNDKLRMSLVGAANGVEVPPVQAFAMPRHPLAVAASADAGPIQATAAPTRDVQSVADVRRPVDELVEQISSLVAQSQSPGAAKRAIGAEIVVEPAGSRSSSLHRAPFIPQQRIHIAARLFALLSDPKMTDRGEVLVTGTIRYEDGSREVRLVRVPAAGVRRRVARVVAGSDIRVQVDRFSQRYAGEEIVVKPSGPQFHSGRGVEFFRKEQRVEMTVHALAIASDLMMSEDGAVIVMGRVNSAPLERGGRKMETTLRVLVARTPSGGAKTMDVFARVGSWGKPTTAEAADPRDSAVIESWEKLLKDWSLTPKQAEALDRRVRDMGEAMLQAIMKMEKALRRSPGEPYQAQTDLIGLDVMIEKRGGELVPVMIEVNDHDSGGQYDMDARIAKDRVGRHSREWVATMLQRGRRDALRGKRIVIVGAGYEGKRFIFEKAKDLGVQIVLVDKPDTFAKNLVSEMIASDNSRPEEALAKTRKKLLASARKNGKIDGLTTFWEDDVPLAAGLAEAMGLPYHTRAAAQAVRSKAQTRDVLEKAGMPTPRHRDVINLNTAQDDSARARLLADFIIAADFVGYPAVLKPAFGAAAMGVKRVDDRAQAVAAFKEMARMVSPETDAIFKQGTGLVLEQYLDGPEWDADVVMQGGKAVFASLTDNKPTREPYFLAAGSRLPSLLSEGRQKESMALAVRSAQALGLTDGVIHMEGKYTSEGARLIEANGRMGGEYVRDWVKAVWGVDLVEENLLAAVGIPIKPFMPEEPLAYLDGDFIIPDKSGVIAFFDLPKKARDDPGFGELRVMKKVGDRIAVPPDGYDRAGMLVARGATGKQAELKLRELKAKLLLDIQ